MTEACVVCGKQVDKLAPRCCECHGPFCRGYCGTLPSHLESADGTLIYVNEIFDYESAKCYRCQGIRPAEEVRQEKFRRLLSDTNLELIQVEKQLRQLEADASTCAAWRVLVEYQRLEGDYGAAKRDRESLANRWRRLNLSLRAANLGVAQRNALLGELAQITIEGRAARRLRDELSRRCNRLKADNSHVIEKARHAKLVQRSLQQRTEQLQNRIIALEDELS